jgi:hypothetical protein
MAEGIKIKALVNVTVTIAGEKVQLEKGATQKVAEGDISAKDLDALVGAGFVEVGEAKEEKKTEVKKAEKKAKGGSKKKTRK